MGFEPGTFMKNPKIISRSAIRVLTCHYQWSEHWLSVQEVHGSNLGGGKIFPTQTRIFILSNQKRVCLAIDEKNESAQKDDAGNRRAIV